MFDRWSTCFCRLTARCPQGGESVALARMEEYLSDTDWVARFEKPKGNPAALERPATTVLSPYLKFGCLSARRMHQRLLQVPMVNTCSTHDHHAPQTAAT